MEKEQYLVSICIPTYNRAPYLKKCLDSLVCQPEFQQGLVEIVVSDNDSTDDTGVVVHEYQKKHHNISYHKNEYNIGHINGDYNFAVALQKGNGILRKLGGDTRIYKNGSLAYFCNAATKYQKEKPILYFCNGNHCDDVEEENITNLEHFLKSTSFVATWIDTFFIWGTECGKILEFAENSDSGFWFIEMNVELMQQKQSAVIFKECIIEGNEPQKKNISYGIFEVFYNNYMGIFCSLKEKHLISKECFEYLEKDLLFGFFLYSILTWEFNDGTYIYAPEENLKAAVFHQYEKKDYFPEFLKLYRRMRIKWEIKRLPIVGRLLVRLKHQL